jgi:hypothetical protein
MTTVEITADDVPLAAPEVEISQDTIGEEPTIAEDAAAMPETAETATEPIIETTPETAAYGVNDFVKDYFLNQTTENAG